MTNTRITNLTELATIDDTADVVAIADTSAGETKKLSWSTIRTTIATYLASLSQTLTNKTIDADSNTITNIENADIKAAAGIALNKLAATTASRALVSDGSGFVTPATTTATEIGYVNGVTSAIQTQINTKAPTASPSFTGTVTLPTGLTGVLRADSGVVSTDSNVTDLVSAADTTTAGKVELATDAETLAASSDSVVMTPGNFGANIIRVYKSADETVNNSDVVQNDNHLFFAVGANEVWAFHLACIFASGLTPDIKVGWSVPTGTTMSWENDVNGGNVLNTESTTEQWSGVGGSTMGQTWGTVFVGGTAGNVQLQWAQNVADMSDTVVKQGSYIIAHRLA